MLENNCEVKASRDLTWNELEDSRKIERLRKIIKDQGKLIERMTNYLNELIEHEHLDGKLVKRLYPPNQGSPSGFYLGKRDDEWF